MADNYVDITLRVQGISEAQRATDQLSRAFARLSDIVERSSKSAELARASFASLSGVTEPLQGGLQSFYGKLSRTLQDATQSLGLFKNTASRNLLDLVNDFINFKNVVLSAIGWEFVSSIQNVIESLDRMTAARAKLSTVSLGVVEFSESLKELRRIAAETGAPLDSLITIYSKMVPVLHGLGISGKDATRVIETLYKAIAMSASNVQEATSALLQFTQGLASGALRGDEFRSVMENSQYLVKILADNIRDTNGVIGVSIGRLIEMAGAGQLTSRVLVDALSRAASRVDADFRGMAEHVGRAWAGLKSAIISYLDDVNRAYGITQGLASAIRHVTENLMTYIAAFKLTVGTIMVALGGPVTAIVGLITYISGLKDVFSSVFESIGINLDRVAENIKNFFADTRRATESWEDKTRQELAKLTEEVAKQLGASLGKIGQSLDELSGKLKEVVGAIEERMARIHGVASTLASGVGAYYDSLLAGLKNLASASTKEAEQALQKAQKTYQGLGSAYDNYANTVVTTSLRIMETEIRRVQNTYETERLQLIKNAKSYEEYQQGLVALTRSTEEKIISIRSEAIDKLVGLYNKLTEAAEKHFEKIRKLEEDHTSYVESLDRKLFEAKVQGLDDFSAKLEYSKAKEEAYQKALEELSKGNIELAKHYRDIFVELATKEAEAAQQSRIRSLEMRATSEATQKALEEEKRKKYDLFLLQESFTKAKELDAQITQQAIAREKEGYDAIATSLVTVSNILDSLKAKQEEVLKGFEKEYELKIKYDEQQVQEMVKQLESMLGDKEIVLKTILDLENAAKTLSEYKKKIETDPNEALKLKAEIDVELAKIKAQLDTVKEIARQYGQVKVALEIEGVAQQVAQARSQIEKLNELETRSRHIVTSNVDEVKAEIRSLDGMNTSSTHTIYVRRVEENATGGLVGAFKRVSGWLPGWGHKDNIPALLQAGEYVIRKEAVAKYGRALLDMINLRKFAAGGYVTHKYNKESEFRDNMAYIQAHVEPSLLEKIADLFGEFSSRSAFIQDPEFSWLLAVLTKLTEKLRDVNYYKNIKPQLNAILDKLSDFVNRVVTQIDAGREINQYLALARISSIDRYLKTFGLGMSEYIAAAPGRGFVVRGTFSTGGYVPSLLQSGEYVVSAPAVTRYGVALMDAINNLSLPKFSSGGSVGAISSVGGGRVINIDIGTITIDAKELKKLNDPAFWGFAFEKYVIPVIEKNLRLAM